MKQEIKQLQAQYPSFSETYWRAVATIEFTRQD